MALPEESTYRTLARALNPLEETGVLRYLPKFEDCGSCAWARIASDDWGSAEGFAMFNEQSKEEAEFSNELYLTVSSFGDGEEEKIFELVEAALIEGGFKRITVENPEIHTDLVPNSFFRRGGALVIWGYFHGKAKRLSGYKHS